MALSGADVRPGQPRSLSPRSSQQPRPPSFFGASAAQTFGRVSPAAQSSASVASPALQPPGEPRQLGYRALDRPRQRRRSVTGGSAAQAHERRQAGGRPRQIGRSLSASPGSPGEARSAAVQPAASLWCPAAQTFGSVSSGGSAAQAHERRQASGRPRQIGRSRSASAGSPGRPRVRRFSPWSGLAGRLRRGRRGRLPGAQRLGRSRRRRAVGGRGRRSAASFGPVRHR
jgi:hypothetical protein